MARIRIHELSNNFDDTHSSSTSTTISAAASPSTFDMASAENVPSGTAEHTTVTKQIIDPYSTVGQLSYAPATQTTVVTTTTTTTTSFPPLFLRPPRHLVERDPRQYPLAASPTPSSLKRLNFSLNGVPAIFCEADDPEGMLQEADRQYAALRAAQGTLTSITNKETQYRTPNRLSRPSSSNKPSSRSFLAPSHMPTQRRGVSPPSITEAVELASLHRRNKRRRQPLEETAPATPDTDAGGSGQFRLSRSRLSRESRLSKESESAEASTPLTTRRTQRNTQSQGRTSSSNATESGSSLRLAAPLLTEPVAGISATPPMAESDLEPVFTVDQQPLDIARPRHLSPLDTSSAQDASLPSPSLSPTTAAANLAADLSFDGSLNDDTDIYGDFSMPESAHRGLGVSNLQTSKQLSSVTESRDFAQTAEDAGSNPRLSTPTFMDISTMIHTFDAMPNELQTYIMYQMLRRSAKPTLRLVADVVNPALKRDFLADLPLELSLDIVKYLDAKSMCRAAQVSKRWRQIVDSDEKAWHDLMKEDGYDMPEGEVERAVHEGWGWQFPDGPDSSERNLNESNLRSDGASSPRSALGSSHADYDTSVAEVSTSSRKRKAVSKSSSHKRRRTKGPSSSSSKTPTPVYMKTLDSSSGPMAYANAAAAAVPNADVGLPTLRNLHLYKSLYHRHHAIRKAWMEQDVKPHHLAFKAHGNHVVTCLQFDTEKIITGSDDNKINVYDTKTGAKRRTLEGHEGGVWALQYDGNTMVSGSTDRSVRVWDIEKGKCLQIFQGHTSTVRCLVILKPTKIGEHPDGTPIIMPREPLIITGSRDSTLRVWKLPQPGDKSVYHSSPPANDHSNQYFIRALTGHQHSVRAIAAHGDTLVSGSYDHTVRVWKISTGETVHTLRGHTQKVYSVVLDHKRNRCISGSMDYLVKVWSLDTGTMLFNLDGHTSLVGLLDLSNERLVSAAADSTLRIWDPENGKCENILTAHTGAITCFQHDGQKVISGSDGMLKMWDIETGECVKDLLTGLSGVWQVRFNDRRCVAAVHRNNWTYIEVLDFGAVRDGIPENKRGVRIAVDEFGTEYDDTDALTEASAA